jgi:ligand-binding sensor domain-containing protein
MSLGNSHRLPYAAVAAGLALLCLAAVPLAADSLNIHFDRVSTEDGMSQEDVHAILQDRQGFIWIATQDGLNRFDGYEFETDRHAGRRPQPLGPREQSFPTFSPRPFEPAQPE